VKEIMQMPDRPIRTDSNLENIIEIVDPTGISSWDDVYRSARDHGISSKETIIDALGAIPMFGKLSKLGKAAEIFSKAFAVTGRQKRNAKAAAETFKAVGKYGPSLGRATDAKQAYDERNNEYAMGGALPGAVGFTYARTAGSAPANGKYTKKTKASAQNGSVIKDDRGQLAYPGEITEIGSNDITMQGVDYPVLGVSDTGDTQMMYPDQDYKFDGEKVTEFPMAQNGRNVATTADSLRVYNSQMALNKFYENEMKVGRLKKSQVYDYPDIKYGNMVENWDKNLRKDNLDFYRTQILRRSNKLYTFDDNYKKTFNLSPEQVRQLENKGLAQTKGSSEYQEYYRDLITPMQNLASPFALVDKRIYPQRQISYSPVDPNNYPGGEVVVHDYDPILVKPVNMLTPEERALRIKKYGKDSGIKETVSKPIQKPVSKPIPKSEPKPEPAPVVAKQPTPEQSAPQPKPLYEYEGEQVMAPVPSGGGAAMVGVKKKDGTIEYIKPEDYQRMSVPKYGQDYIKSKQKMQDGGWLNKYK
jgi:hypothetical protein